MNERSEREKKPHFATIKDAAQLIGLSEWTIRRLVKEARIPGFYVGRKYYVNMDKCLSELGVEV